MLPSRRYEPSYPPQRNTHSGSVQPLGEPAPPSTWHLRPRPQQPAFPPQQQQQQQHQQQQQQQQHESGTHSQLGNGGQGGSVDAQSMAGGSGGFGGAGQEMNLASVLHYLQSEWRRWERDRNEWEIERAEMRARIALLEGQRRSAENLKVDLLRRVKMLEFALRQERTKVSSTGTIGKATGIAPSKLASLQDDDRASNKDEKEGSDSGGSGGSDERDDGDRVKINGNHAGTSKSSGSSKASDTSPWKNIGAVPRDPKSRARSREYLKQCLQEITYLTSPGALNPLPNRPLISDLDQASPSSGPIQPEPERPTKSLPSRSIPPLFEKPKEEGEEAAPQSQAALPNGIVEDPQTTEPPRAQEAEASQRPPSPTTADPPKTHLSNIETSAKPPSSPLVRTKGLPEANDTADTGQADAVQHHEDTNQLLTAIYRPESKAAWREELRAANEKAAKSRKERSSESSPNAKAEDELSNLNLSVDEDEVKGDNGGLTKMWTSKRMLKSHLDVARTVAFAGGPGLMLASGGDDNTVKIWSVDPSSLSSSSRPASLNIDPIATFRGHTSPVTAIAISHNWRLVFSASLDSSIRIWQLPDPSADPYAPHDPSSAVQTLVGHTDAIWDLCLLPSRTMRPNDGTPLLCSCSADGTVKFWERRSRKWQLETSLACSTGVNEGAVPTCLGRYHRDSEGLLVGMSNGNVCLWDLRTSTILREYNAGQSGQPNCVVSHETRPIIVAGYEDGYIRIFDTETREIKHEILAHPEPVTSIALSPESPSFAISSGSNCIIRVWDLTKGIAVQDLGGHRTRGGEGVCKVVGHPDHHFLASAGADGVVRLWASS